MHRHVMEPGRYEVKTASYTLENILIAVDIDKEADAEMKAVSSSVASKGPALRRMDAVKQALLFFIHSKLTMNPLHQFAFVTLGRFPSWHQREFTSNLDVISTSVRTLNTDAVGFDQFDLSSLLQVAATEARTSISQGRTLRLVLIYCRSSVVPEFSEQWLERQNSFTLDALYMHDKPSPTNCPQRVYDALVDALEHVSQHEGYIFESSSGSARTLFKHICFLLCHPHQRVVQDEVTNIKDLAQARLAAEVTAAIPQADAAVGGRGG
ncbi:unnamed protein product [Calypogeia fissa]